MSTPEWRAANRDKLRANWTRWRGRHLEKARAEAQRWNTENPEKAAAKRARRRATQRSAACSCCPPWVFKFIYAQARALGMHVDHVKPLARGGLHCLKNMQLLSPADNFKKGSRETSQ